MNSVVFIILALMLSAVAMLAVAYPILVKARATGTTAASAQEELDELLAQRDAVYQALRELSFDHRVGKITGEDFTAFEAHLKGVAADTLRALDRWERESDDELDSVLERAVDARRAALGADARPCPSCGRMTAATDKFCGACGATLSVATGTAAVETARCARCGRPYEPGDRFCAGCGQALPQGERALAGS